MSPHYYSKRQPYSSTEKIISFSKGGIKLKLYTGYSLFSKNKIDIGTDLLLDYIIVPEEGVVLDLGTGTGLIGIYIAKLNPKLKVYLSDVNPNAIKLARKNVLENEVSDRVTVIQSDLFEELRSLSFEAIYTNPPLSAGWKVIEGIIKGSYEHLKDKGFLQMVVAAGENKVLNWGSKIFHETRVLKRKKGYSIILFKKS